MLNVHRGELAYLEWQRAIAAMTNGCVFLTEHSLGFEPLVPGEHFISASFGNLDVALYSLLEDPDHVARVRTAAYEFLRDAHPLSASINVLADAIAEVARRPITHARQHSVAPRPAPPAHPPAEYERIANERSEIGIVRMAAKQILLDQRELRAAVRDLQDTVDRAARDDVVERFGLRRSDPPRVSVVITVYNYASVVGEAIGSVSLSDFEDYEVVIVDDASTDHSGTAIREALSASPWVASTVITRGRNGGLARARNLGAEFASGELVFMLDADNAVYPHALGRLVRALDETPNAFFAYGMIVRFAVTGPIGLTSYLGWEPERLRYGNFVDAMAMIRRSSLLEAGGYTTDPRLYGWEDFALWCAFADLHWDGVLVPEIVARYRVGLQSMITVTDIDATAAWSALVSRFRCLTATPASASAAAP
jgi:hypothetical protein